MKRNIGIKLINFIMIRMKLTILLTSKIKKTHLLFDEILHEKIDFT
jgi:hypothetical protein